MVRLALSAINQLRKKCQEGMFWSPSKSENVGLSSHVERDCSDTLAWLNLCFWWCYTSSKAWCKEMHWFCGSVQPIVLGPALCSFWNAVVQVRIYPSFWHPLSNGKNLNRLKIPWSNASWLKERLFAGIRYCLSAKDGIFSRNQMISMLTCWEQI